MSGAIPHWLLPVLGSATGVFVGTLIATRLQRSRHVESPDAGPAVSVECWVRTVVGGHPHLTHRWRVGRALVKEASIELTLFRWGVRPWRRSPFVVHVEAVDRDAVQRSGWLQSLRFGDPHRLVAVRTASGGALQLALRPVDLDAVLDVLQGRPPGRHRGNQPYVQVAKPKLCEESRAFGRTWGSRREHLRERTVRAVGWTAVDSAGEALSAGDLAGQVESCLGDVQAQLEAVQASLSEIVHVTVRTTDFTAARAHAQVLGRLLRQGGAAASIKVVSVPGLAVREAVVELEVQALQHSWSSGRAWEQEPPNAAVPQFLRAAVMAELDALVRGGRPEEHAYFDDHLADGAALVDQPEEVWEHPWSQASRTRDGVWEVVVPLWTTNQAPSDLWASVEVDPSGRATLSNVFA